LLWNYSPLSHSSPYYSQNSKLFIVFSTPKPHFSHQFSGFCRRHAVCSDLSYVYVFINFKKAHCVTEMSS
jgi:hypothetical protein